MDASEVKNLMASAFTSDAPINHNYLCEPFYVNIAINLNSGYNPAFKEEPFKY